MKPNTTVTASNFLEGEVLYYSASETVAVSTTVNDTPLCICLDHPVHDDDSVIATSEKKVPIAISGYVWVRSETAQSWTFGAPVYNAPSASTAGTVETTNANSATKIGFYFCDYLKNVGADRTTTAAGELIGVKLDIYSEAT
jgi:hypothetical protein